MIATNKWTVLVVVAFGVFMATLDSSIVNISLPSIAAHFGVSLGGAIAWIVIGYLVVVAASLMTAGRLADIVGHRRAWLAGLALFTGFSAACGLAPSLPLLIAARALQGIGAALLMALGPALLTSAFPPEQRGRALGMNGLFVALGVSTGPTLGGILTERLSWRWIFFANLPIGVLALVAAALVLTAQHSPEPRRPVRFDVAGATLLGIGLAAATAALSFGNELGWSSPSILTALVVAAVSFGALTRVERRRAHALVDAELFRDRTFSYSLVALVVSFLGLFATSFLMPFYLERIRGLSTEQAGITMTALPVTLAVVAPLAGGLADRIGSRVPCVLGMLLASAGLLALSGLGADASSLRIASALVMIGAGQGLFQPANNSALLGASPLHRRGVASGILATGRVVGQSLSIALSGAILNAFAAAQAGKMLALGADPPAFLRGFRAALVTNAALAATAAVLSLLRGKTPAARRRENA